jgi:hypothetical protein
MARRVGRARSDTRPSEAQRGNQGADARRSPGGALRAIDMQPSWRFGQEANERFSAHQAAQCGTQRLPPRSPWCGTDRPKWLRGFVRTGRYRAACETRIARKRPELSGNSTDTTQHITMITFTRYTRRS